MNDYAELYHHGVKGQRWGVRRAQDSTEIAKNKAQARLTTERTKAAIKETKIESKERDYNADYNVNKRVKRDIKAGKK